MRSYLKKIPSQKKGLVEWLRYGLEFKPQYHKKKRAEIYFLTNLGA
jgi:hypothetical protein